MAARKKTTTRKKPQYVRTKKRKGTDSAALTKRSATIVLVVLIIVGALLGIKAGFGWIHNKLFSKNPRFEIQHLVISSDGKQLTEERIREYIGLREGDNLFAFDFEDIEKELAKVSIIESVSFERKLPHTLIIQVKERIPVARIAGPSVRRFPNVVDRYGFVLPPRRSTANLPLIKGLETDPRLGQPVEHADVETSLKIIGLCESSGYLRSFIRVESLDVKYSDFIVMRLKGGIQVRMPRFSIKPKLQKLASVINIATGQGLRVKEVDLTLDSAKVPVTYY